MRSSPGNVCSASGATQRAATNTGGPHLRAALACGSPVWTSSPLQRNDSADASCHGTMDDAAINRAGRNAAVPVELIQCHAELL